MNDHTTSCEQQVNTSRFALSTRQLLLIGVLLCAVLALEIIAICQMPDGLLHVAFLDVGQGDAILIITPAGRQILIDGGPEPSLLNWNLGKMLPMWDRSLDLVVLTHADSDHMAGLIPVFERYKVDTALTSQAVLETDGSATWREAVAQSGAHTAIAQRGVRIIVDENTELTVLHPPSKQTGAQGHDNDLSVVLRLSYGHAGFLFTGDLEAQGELDLLESEQSLDAQVLKVSHHGAGGATTERFLAIVNPDLAVIQVGADNHFGHPTEATLDRLQDTGAQILRTDLNGTIEVVTDGSELHVRSNR
jgi:competence protein ComEC